MHAYISLFVNHLCFTKVRNADLLLDFHELLFLSMPHLKKSILKLLNILIAFLFCIPWFVDSIGVLHIRGCCVFKHLHILIIAKYFPLSIGLVVFLRLDESFTIPAATFLLSYIFLIPKLFVACHFAISSFLPSMLQFWYWPTAHFPWLYVTLSQITSAILRKMEPSRRRVPRKWDFPL